MSDLGFAVSSLNLRVQGSHRASGLNTTPRAKRARVQLVNLQIRLKDPSEAEALQYPDLRKTILRVILCVP